MNLLITGAWAQAKQYIEILESKGNKVCFQQYERDELVCEYEWVDGIICNGLFLKHPIEKFINLKYIQLTSAGLDRVPMKYVLSHCISINNARGVYSIPMAEFAVLSVLSLYKGQSNFWANQKNHIWEKQRNLLELDGKSVCILGCGSVGTECAKRFKGFGCEILGIDIVVDDKKDYFDCIYLLKDIKIILSKADIVIVTLPLTSQTKKMFNKELFERMKDNSVIVNIARGALIDTNALIMALENRLFGAALDVFEDEPLGDSLLWDMPNVLITPHNSFVGNNNDDRMSKVVLENLEVYHENISNITKKQDGI